MSVNTDNGHLNLGNVNAGAITGGDDDSVTGFMATANANVVEASVDLGNGHNLEVSGGVGVDTGLVVDKNRGSVKGSLGGLGVEVGCTIGVSTWFGTISVRVC